MDAGCAKAPVIGVELATKVSSHENPMPDPVVEMYPVFSFSDGLIDFTPALNPKEPALLQTRWFSRNAPNVEVRPPFQQIPPCRINTLQLRPIVAVLL